MHSTRASGRGARPISSWKEGSLVEENFALATSSRSRPARRSCVVRLFLLKEDSLDGFGESFRTGGEVIEDVPVLELLDVQPVDGQGSLLIPGQYVPVGLPYPEDPAIVGNAR